MKPGSKVPDSPPRLFKDQEAWKAWLNKNHGKSAGIWVRLAKKGSGIHSLSYREGLESALCYGWIDGQKKPENEQTWLQRFVPRSDKSIWSRINREKAEALLKAGRMQPAGLEAIGRAKANGRWNNAYDSPGRAAV